MKMGACKGQTLRVLATLVTSSSMLTEKKPRQRNGNYADFTAAGAQTQEHQYGERKY